LRGANIKPSTALFGSRAEIYKRRSDHRVPNAYALIVSILIGAGLAFAPVPTLAALACAALVLVLVSWPNSVFYLTAILAVVTLPSSIPDFISLPGYQLHLYEPVLLLATASALVRFSPATDDLGRVVLLLLLLLGWIIWGLLKGNSISWVITDIRYPAEMIMAMLIANRVLGTQVPSTLWNLLIPTLWLSAGVLIFASVSGIEIWGRSLGATLLTNSNGEEATRYLTPSLYPSVAIIAGVVAASVAGKERLAKFIPWIVPALIITILGFTRNTILAVAIASIYGAIAGGVYRPIAKLAKVGAALAIVVVLIVFGLSVTGIPNENSWIGSQIASFNRRVVDGITPSAISEDSSAQYRFKQENTYLYDSIAESPFLGHGYGYAYKPLYTGQPLDSNSEYARYYAHNFYLWLAAKSGFIGLIIFLMAFAWPVLRPLRLGTGLEIAAGGAAAGMLAASLVAPMPLGSPTALVLGTMVGIAAAAGGKGVGRLESN